MPAPLGFLFLRRLWAAIQHGSQHGWPTLLRTTNRSYAMPLTFPSRCARFGLSYALVLACTFVSLAAAQQQTSGNTTDTKPAAKSSSSAQQGTAKSSASAHTTSAHTTSHTASAKKSSRKKKPTRTKGQQKIDPERARSIQEALIREHYLTGEPSGAWNQQSEEAMRKYQADHGWQSKTVPDSRALIALGLGPNHDHLLNPESAMTTAPATPHASSAPPASQTAPPASSTPASSTVPSDPPNK